MLVNYDVKAKYIIRRKTIVPDTYIFGTHVCTLSKYGEDETENNKNNHF